LSTADAISNAAVTERVRFFPPDDAEDWVNFFRRSENRNPQRYRGGFSMERKNRKVMKK
jgi:hypothetical protein